MSVNYVDTRGLCPEPVPFTQAVIEGLATGGGLFVPESIPTLTLNEIVALADMPYAKRAAFIYKRFDVDVPDELVDECMDRSYADNFDSEDICPITSLDDKTHILELWHGPTSAFKDMALQCMPHFFSASIRLQQERGILDHDFLILVATSGDTGKAALEGFADVDHVSISVLYPHGGVSDIQFKQMATQRGSNVHVYGVHGNFDDCQTGVKKVFSNEAYAEKLQAEYRIALSSANSINWGRLLPQIVYYVSAYSELVKRGAVEAGGLIDVCVPTGNFGNILAAWYAKQVGTPIGMLFCASNENRVLTDFINTGVYDISDRTFVLTPSPSMDILVSSNLERQLFELSGRNAEAIKGWMADLSGKAKFSIDADTFAKIQEAFIGDSVDNATCLKTIREVHDEYGYLLDPHTAVGYKVAMNLRGERPVLVASTAHWAKFSENVYRALRGLEPGAPLPDEIAALSGCELNNAIAEEAGNTYVPKGLAELDELPLRFQEVIDPDEASIQRAIEAFLDSLQ